MSKVGARRDEQGGWLPWNRPEGLRQGREDNLEDRSSTPVLKECTRRRIAFVPFFFLGSGFGIDDVRGDPSVIATASSVPHLEKNSAAADFELGRPG